MVSEMEKIDNRSLIQTLIRGQDSAKRLQDLLCRNVDVDGSVSVSVEDLLTEILGSFSGGLSILNSDSSEMYGLIPGSPHVGLASPGVRTPEVYSGKKPAMAVKERRGCYKRRRTVDSDVKVSATMEDGYAWRKYGQKEILNSTSPRCYFRCTHKHVHGCKAQRQVQKSEDDPNMYHITYIGHHTCPTSKTLSHREIVLNFEDTKPNFNVLNSPSIVTNVHNEPSIKQEVDSKAQSTDVTDVSDDNVSSANEENSSPSLWNEIFRGDHLGSYNEGVSFLKYDNEQSSASTSSHGYFYMNFSNNDDLLNDILFDQAFS